MKKKSFLKYAGIFTALVAVACSAFSCHLSKKTPEQKDSDKRNNENQNIIKEESDIKKYIKIVPMYGLPTEENIKPQIKENSEDIIIIEKYGIPVNPEEDKRILKYAVPKIIPPFQKSIKKYDVPYYDGIPEVKYAIPEYMDNPSVEKYAVPSIDNIPVLKYATPYFPQKETKEK